MGPRQVGWPMGALIRVVVRDIGWRERRLVQSAAKPNMLRKTNPPEPDRGNDNNRIRPNYPIIAFGNCSR